MTKEEIAIIMRLREGTEYSEEPDSDPNYRIIRMRIPGAGYQFSVSETGEAAVERINRFVAGFTYGQRQSSKKH